MAEPHTTAGALAGAGFSLGFSVLGADADALLLGLVMAVLSAILSDAVDRPGKAFAVVLMAAIFSGFLGPVLVGFAGGWLPHSDPAALRLALAVVIGAAWPPLWPHLLMRATRILRGGDAA